LFFFVLVCFLNAPSALSQRARQRPIKKPGAAAPQPVDKRQQVEQLLKQGETYFYENQPDKAFPALDQAAQLYHELNDRRGEAETLGKLGSSIAKPDSRAKA
jgi:hypothetical protein